MGRKIKWGKILRSDERDFRFNLWGLINDPGCCPVGAGGDRRACCERLEADPASVRGDLAACLEATPERTFGFDYCAGDAELLKYVGRVRSDKGVAYNDPRLNPEGKSPYKLDRKDSACELDRFAPGQSTEGDRAQRKQDSCDLDFGTSTGVLGYRKFPNPRFDADAWKRANARERQGAASWAGYESRPADHSLEPPFHIGISCGACHIGLDPARPPRDPNHPAWENIRGLVGNQFVRNAVVLGSGVQPNPHDKSPSTLEWEEFAHERPGATDTSAIPNDQISNPGTMNAVIATQRRPHAFRERVLTWYQEPCDEADPRICWEDPQWRGHERGSKTWHWRESRPGDANYTVYHILKGGEDSIGAGGAVQRVYINIGSCAEQCWLNHLTDLRAFLPNQRGYGQTPFEAGQCRRDCPAYRAIEDRVPELFAWLKSAQPTPLATALEANEEGQRALTARLSRIVTPENVEAGRRLFVRSCSGCHSSVKGDETFKNNWMGSDELKPISLIKTYACRAMHSNHLRGNVWAEFASEKRKDDKTGFYRVPSLLNVWAFAPFLHNNAIGPEVCSRAESSPHPEEKWYTSPYPNGGGQCTPFPVTVLERYELFEKSLQELLTDPESRPKKITLTDREIDYPLIGELAIGPKAKVSGAVLRLPKGLPVGLTGSFLHKEWASDFFLFIRNPEAFKLKAETQFGKEGGEELIRLFKTTERAIFGKLTDGASPAAADLDQDHRKVLRTDLATTRAFFKYYSGCPAEQENTGHAFGLEIGKDPERLRELTAFLATL
jgi:hypothetical protein